MAERAHGVAPPGKHVQLGRTLASSNEFDNHLFITIVCFKRTAHLIEIHRIDDHRRAALNPKAKGIIDIELYEDAKRYFEDQVAHVMQVVLQSSYGTVDDVSRQNNVDDVLNDIRDIFSTHAARI